MRRFIFISHHKLAYGMKDTVDFLTNALKPTYDLNCYLNDEQDVDKDIQELLNRFDINDEIVVFTDMFGGSVNQKFIPIISNSTNNIHAICGANLPLVMSLVMLPENQMLTSEIINCTIEKSKDQILYVNEIAQIKNEEDE